MAFHPVRPIVYVANEISSTVATYEWDAEQQALRPLQILPSLPSDFTGENTTAEIVVSSNGRFVYCSNRGHDSVAIFAADSQSGLLRSIGWTSSRGKSPRFISFDPAGRFLYIANEQGDTIAAFRLNQETGGLTDTGEIVRNASPVTIAFARGG
jgi:6-phosphogluconolactonase (cycloisomerase 2 family)